MADTHDPYAALRFPSARRLITANVISGLGLEMLSAAIGWELYERTASQLHLGLTGLVQFVPVVLLALPAGQLADRVSRQGMYATAQALIAVAAAGLAGVSLVRGPVWLIYVLLTAMGVGRAFTAPARGSLMPLLVPSNALANAIAWHTSGWQIAMTTGPALGGLLLAIFGRADLVYYLSAACFMTCAALAATLQPRPAERHVDPVTLRSLLAGVHFVGSTPLILSAITLDLFAVLFGGAVALLPVFAKDILHVGPWGYGWLRAAPSIGALGMALVMAHRPPLRRAGRTMLVAVAGFGVSTIGFGLSRDPVLSFVLLALTGALDNISIVVRGTLVQLLTPDAMRGRVAAVSSIFIVTSNELGAFESGITAHWFGPVASVVGGGLGTIAVVVLAALRWPELRRLGALRAPPPELAGEQTAATADWQASPAAAAGAALGPPADSEPAGR